MKCVAEATLKVRVHLLDILRLQNFCPEKEQTRQSSQSELKENHLEVVKHSYGTGTKRSFVLCVCPVGVLFLL